MRYYIILSVDCPNHVSINSCLPRQAIKRKLKQTEDDDCCDYSCLEGGWKKGKHRKLVGELNQKDFDRLVDDCNLVADDIETMGYLTEFGHLPAISFNSNSDYSYCNHPSITNCYVTPIFERYQPSEEREERAWNVIKNAIVKKYK
jgi:hypothetical protein